MPVLQTPETRPGSSPARTVPCRPLHRCARPQLLPGLGPCQATYPLAPCTATYTTETRFPMETRPQLSPCTPHPRAPTLTTLPPTPSRQEFEAERKPDLRRDVYLQDIHCVSSLCKAYFRELPDPLLTYRLYDKFAVSWGLGQRTGAGGSCSDVGSPGASSGRQRLSDPEWWRPRSRSSSPPQSPCTPQCPPHPPLSPFPPFPKAADHTRRAGAGGE